MFDGPVSANIGNICGGAVPEQFEHEMRRILANISDPNTDPEAKRSLTLEFKFSPSPDRKAAVVTFICTKRSAGPAFSQTPTTWRGIGRTGRAIHIERHGGR